MDQTFRDIACGLVAISRSFYARGWALGTSGNFTAVLSREPSGAGCWKAKQRRGSRKTLSERASEPHTAIFE